MVVEGAAGMGATIVSSIMYWLGYGVIIIGMIVVGLYVWWKISWQFKLHYWEVVGSGNRGFSVGRMRTTMMKWNPKKTAWKIKTPFLNKKEIQPFKPEHMYPGKTIYAFKLGEEYIPATINYEHQNLSPVSHHIRNWQAMSHKKMALELSKPTFWEENKYFFMVVITACVCLAAVLLTVYYTYEFAKPGAASMGRLADAIQGMTTIGSVAPG